VAILPLAPGQDYLRVSRAGLLLAPNDPHRGGAVCSARPVKRGCTAVPDIDGSVTNTEGLISKQLFHCLYNTHNPIASKTHKQRMHAKPQQPIAPTYHAREGNHRRTPARTADPAKLMSPSISRQAAGAYGRTVIIQARRAAHHPNHYELVALTAQPDRPFGRPRPIAPALLDCPIDGGTPTRFGLTGWIMIYPVSKRRSRARLVHRGRVDG